MRLRETVEMSFRAARIARPRIPTDTRRRFVGPTWSARKAVTDEPTTAPTVPPTATNPKSRLACSGRKRSAIRDQKIETTKRLKTDVHTKKTRPAQMPAPSEKLEKNSQKAMRLTAKKV
jgi:hypothetical protein